MKALMCVPNISEGTDLSIVEKVVDAIRSAPGVMLLDYSSNSDHNRPLLPISANLIRSLRPRALAKTALELIDMTGQKGSTPAREPWMWFLLSQSVGFPRKNPFLLPETLAATWETPWVSPSIFTRMQPPDRKGRTLPRLAKDSMRLSLKNSRTRSGHRMKAPANL